ncbi:zinc-ribbon domain-containing protein [Candidatus Pacearchaeota archaeon]|nr:zinc-ribbon domain-containing protein [Candidatus Pacearchaeota archaeon]
MFKRKECKNCGESIEKKYRFCPYCGELSSRRAIRNEGMLGEDDELIEEMSGFSNSIFGNMGTKMMNKMFESAMKMIEKEMEKEMKRSEQEKVPKAEYQLFINGKRVQPKKIVHAKTKKAEIELPSNYLKNFAALPKKEPKTNIRRFSDKVVYEITIPGVKEVNDLAVIKLENSLELKAVTKGKAYHKIIPINLPVVNYEFSEGKLVLEMDLKE